MTSLPKDLVNSLGKGTADKTKEPKKEGDSTVKHKQMSDDLADAASMTIR